MPIHVFAVYVTESANYPMDTESSRLFSVAFLRLVTIQSQKCDSFFPEKECNILPGT